MIEGTQRLIYRNKKQADYLCAIAKPSIKPVARQCEGNEVCGASAFFPTLS